MRLTNNNGSFKFPGKFKFKFSFGLYVTIALRSAVARNLTGLSLRGLNHSPRTLRWPVPIV